MLLMGGRFVRHFVRAFGDFGAQFHSEPGHGLMDWNSGCHAWNKLAIDHEMYLKVHQATMARTWTWRS